MTTPYLRSSKLRYLIDAFIYFFVWLPFFMGGFWWAFSPKAMISTSDFELAMGLIFIFALVSVKKGALSWTDWTDLSSLRWPLRLATRLNHLSTRNFWVILGACGLASLVMSAAALRRHQAYLSNGFDLGIFTNALWQLLNAGIYQSSLKNNLHLFADHQSFSIGFFLPFFEIFPGPEILLIVQAFFLASGGGAVYLLSRQAGLSYLESLGLIFVYLMYKPMRAANLFDFHPESIILPSFLWGIVGLQSHLKIGRILGLVFICVGLSGKESSGPLCVGIGTGILFGAGFFSGRRWRFLIGSFLVSAGVAVFIVDTMFVPGWFETGDPAYAYLDKYSHLGSTPLQVVLSPFLKPLVFIKSLAGFREMEFLFWLLLPLGFLTLLTPTYLLAALPSLLLLFLPDDTSRLGRSYHYGLEPSVALFWALPTAILVAERKFADSLARILSATHMRPRTLVMLCLLFASGAASAPSDAFYIRRFKPTSHQEWLGQNLLPKLHKTNSFAAPSNIVPHLALRAWVQHLPHLRQGDKWVDCVIWDLSQNRWPMSDQEVSAVFETLQKNFLKVFSEGSVTVYQSSDAKENCL